jgi:GMP synthase-like glutamine amidotransferase
MRALVIAPDFTELPGLVGAALEANGFDLDRFTIVPAERYETPNVSVELPDPNAYDLVVLLGAPWGAWDDGSIGTWLADLLELIRTAQRDDVPFLGICFGGQALARALGGSVAPGPIPEIGWTDIESDRPDLISTGPWFQWHYDRLTPPPEATEIARNDIASQAFVIGRSLGVQFHPEVDLAELTGWLGMGGHGEALDAGFDPDILISDTEANLAAATERTNQLVRAYLAQVALLS